MIIVLEDGIPIDSIYRTSAWVNIVDVKYSSNLDTLAYIDEFSGGPMRYYLYTRTNNQFNLERYIGLRGQVYYGDVGVMPERDRLWRSKEHTRLFRLEGLTRIVEYDTAIKNSESVFSVYDNTRVFLYEGPFHSQLKLRKKPVKD